VIDNLEIYFTKEIGDRFVEGTAKYFDQNNLILDETHSIQITSDSESFILKMVLNDEYKSLPISQQKNLALLESDLKETVFEGLNFRIEVCNANFVPLSTLN
jgi:hypothetical protein